MTRVPPDCEAPPVVPPAQGGVGSPGLLPPTAPVQSAAAGGAVTRGAPGGAGEGARSREGSSQQRQALVDLLREVQGEQQRMREQFEEAARRFDSGVRRSRDGPVTTAAEPTPVCSCAHASSASMATSALWAVQLILSFSTRELVVLGAVLGACGQPLQHSMTEALLALTAALFDCVVKFLLPRQAEVDTVQARCTLVTCDKAAAGRSSGPAAAHERLRRNAAARSRCWPALR